MNTQDTPVNLSLTDWNGRETYRRNTANCYIVRNEGTFQIPLVYGNAIKDNQVNTESFYTKDIATDFQDSYGVPFNAWSSPFIKEHASAQGKSIVSAEVLWNDGKSKINNLSVDDNFLTFDVESFSPCNALIAVKDNDGTILWSWHLWLTDTDLTPKVITNKDGVDFKLMPCNLGWNGWTKDGKPTSPHYQWGRKDPFIANGNVSYESISNTQEQYISHQNPKTFYHCEDAWSWTSDKHNYFWDSKMNGSSVDQKVTKTIYDPCPIGWSIPQYNTFTGLSENNTTVADNGRYCTTKEGSRDLFIPFAGYRNYYSGSVFSIDDFGNCWLSAPNSENNGHQLNLNMNGLNPQNNNNRCFGFSVRPLLTESDTAPKAPFLPPKKFSFEEIHYLLFRAYYKTRTSDRNTPDQLKFEIDYEKNLFDLARELYTGTYKFSPALCFVVIEKVKREVFAPQFRDRVVSTMLFELLQPMLEPGFIFDSYSCRKGKGTSEGIRRFEHHLRSVTQNYTKQAYILYMDIEGYFMSIDHEILRNIITDKINKRKHILNPQNQLPWYKCIDIDFTLKLTEMFIFRDVKKDCIIISKPEDFIDIPDKKRLLKQPEGKGLIIGDQCSQLFSNIIGDILDQFVKHKMKCIHYGRYVDDSYSMDCCAEFLKNVQMQTDAFMKQNLKLNLHPHKTKIVNTKEGIAFLGAFLTYSPP